MGVQGAGGQRPGGGGGEVGALRQARVEPGQSHRGREGVVDGDWDAGAPGLSPLPIIEAWGQRPRESGGGRGRGGGLARVRGIGAGDRTGDSAGPVHTGHP